MQTTMVTWQVNDENRDYIYRCHQVFAITVIVMSCVKWYIRTVAMRTHMCEFIEIYDSQES